MKITGSSKKGSEGLERKSLFFFPERERYLTAMLTETVDQFGQFYRHPTFQLSLVFASRGGPCTVNISVILRARYRRGDETSGEKKRG